jgi:hypothetical protein
MGGKISNAKEPKAKTRQAEEIRRNPKRREGNQPVEHRDARDRFVIWTFGVWIFSAYGRSISVCSAGPGSSGVGSPFTQASWPAR